MLDLNWGMDLDGDDGGDWLDDKPFDDDELYGSYRNEFTINSILLALNELTYHLNRIANALEEKK